MFYEPNIIALISGDVVKMQATMYVWSVYRKNRAFYLCTYVVKLRQTKN